MLSATPRAAVTYLNALYVIDVYGYIPAEFVEDNVEFGPALARWIVTGLRVMLHTA